MSTDLNDELRWSGGPVMVLTTTSRTVRPHKPGLIWKACIGLHLLWFWTKQTTHIYSSVYLDEIYICTYIYIYICIIYIQLRIYNTCVCIPQLPVILGPWWQACLRYPGRFVRYQIEVVERIESTPVVLKEERAVTWSPVCCDKSLFEICCPAKSKGFDRIIVVLKLGEGNPQFSDPIFRPWRDNEVH